MALPITSGNGAVESQANTQSPQTSAGSGSPAGAPAKNVQPGTVDSLLTGGQGVPLTSTQLSVVNLSTAPTTITGTTHASVPPQHHHAKPVLIGAVGLLVVIATIAIVIINRSAKKTTY